MKNLHSCVIWLTLRPANREASVRRVGDVNGRPLPCNQLTAEPRVGVIGTA